MDGSSPTLKSYKYTSPVEIDRSVVLKAVSVKDGQVLGLIPAEQAFNVHKAIGREVAYEHPVSRYFQADGPNSLTDGVRGTLVVSKYWHGFNAKDMVATIDLGRETTIEQLMLGALQKQVDWIFLPKRVRFELSSDGVSFQEVAVVNNPVHAEDADHQTVEFVAAFSETKARYVRVTAANHGLCPPGHPGEGHPTWLFVDEIVAE
ncbi:beta-hexosaminidase [Geofilum rubicundum JCM 15548]|uniref:Beta-hexosaminidase n=2 Tax=Geofilum TaxID=1236988 RepID=A0A0E9LTX5_9BACT|nr:beta-hexosaminidase [Geofilum rubicundum JCM 15548]